MPSKPCTRRKVKESSLRDLASPHRLSSRSLPSQAEIAARLPERRVVLIPSLSSFSVKIFSEYSPKRMACVLKAWEYIRRDGDLLWSVSFSTDRLYRFRCSNGSRVGKTFSTMSR